MADPIEIEPLHAVVEAFLDGEAVESSMLRTALADANARDHFIDLLTIRGVLNGMDSVSMSAAVPLPRAPRHVRWLAAVAAGVLVSLPAGYLAGQRALAATAVPATVEAVVISETAPAAPEPTRSITLKPGLNWTDRSGGR